MRTGAASGTRDAATGAVLICAAVCAALGLLTFSEPLFALSAACQGAGGALLFTSRK